MNDEAGAGWRETVLKSVLAHVERVWSFSGGTMAAALLACGRPRSLGRVAILAGLALAATSAAVAHHTYSMFDARRQVTLHGTVREFQWTNPHCFLQVVVPGARAREEWSIQMDSPQTLYRKGWRPGALKPGDAVSVIIHPTRAGSRSGQFMSGTGPDGKPLRED
jgi:hypothetical protein